MDEEPGPALAPPESVALEVAIAMGRPSDSPTIAGIADPVPLACPGCGGTLSQIRRSPLRFRCQVGHGYTADALAHEQEGSVDEAFRIALRVSASGPCSWKRWRLTRCRQREPPPQLFLWGGRNSTLSTNRSAIHASKIRGLSSWITALALRDLYRESGLDSWLTKAIAWRARAHLLSRIPLVAECDVNGAIAAMNLDEAAFRPLEEAIRQGLQRRRCRHGRTDAGAARS